MIIFFNSSEANKSPLFQKRDKNEFESFTESWLCQGSLVTRFTPLNETKGAKVGDQFPLAGRCRQAARSVSNCRTKRPRFIRVNKFMVMKKKKNFFFEKLMKFS